LCKICKMHRGSKGRSRGGGRGGEVSRGGGRGGTMVGAHGLNQNVRREGSNDSPSFCAGAASVPMGSTQRRGRGGGGRGRVGSKCRGAFVSTVGSKSFR